MRLKNRLIKFISATLVIAILTPVFLFSQPKKVEAFWGATWLTDVFTGGTVGTTGTSAGAEVTQTALKLKDVAKEILKQVVMTVQKRLLASFTTSTVNWINSGFHGSPLFVQNPSAFFKDIAKFQIKDFVDLTGYNNSKFPFGREFALSTIGAYKRQFSDNAQYTLSKVINDPNQLEKLRTDFAIGGWNAFLVNTQYPQNNYLGYRMIATEELARRLDGTAVSKANQVKDTLQQGMGFLSPKTCPSNPRYNNGKNEFQQPKFNNAEYTKTHEFKVPAPVFEYVSDPNDPEGEAGGKLIQQETYASQQAREKYITDWQRAQANAVGLWRMDNTCPDGLVSTTPGSVVASQITTALGSTFRQTELGAALGNSISAVFDALLNKFLGEGLNALATKVNPKAPVDDWSYEGQTLGSPNDSTNPEWNTGPDEEIVLSEFKKQLEGKTIVTVSTARVGATRAGGSGSTGGIGGGTVTTGNQEITTREEIGNTGNGEYIPGDIANTEKEIALIDNPATCNLTDPNCDRGLMQMLGELWPKARDLDICQPGPDLGWQDRTLEEIQRNSNKFQGKLNDSDGEKAALANLVLKELRFAVNFLKDWILNNMMTELPNSVIYMDSVEEIGKLAQQDNELTNLKRTRTQALARLQAIKSGLDSITRTDDGGNVIQPEAGSSEEKILISLKKQYNANRVGISNSNTVDEMKNELAIAKEKLARLNGLVSECNDARKKKGWSVPGGAFSTITDSKGNSGTEKGILCDVPIKSGYDHGEYDGKVLFTHGNDKPPGSATNLEIPYVNANKVKYSWGFWGSKETDIKVSCKIIWEATILDYKGNLPGTTQNIPTYQELPDDTGSGTPSGSDLGTCTTTNPDTGQIITDTDVAQSQCTSQGGTWTSS